jgi:hypothetical protein
VVACWRALETRTARAGYPFEIQPTASHELSKPDRGSVSKLTLGRALCSIGFRRIESDQPNSFASDVDGVAVNDFDLTGADRFSIRHHQTADDGEC